MEGAIDDARVVAVTALAQVRFAPNLFAFLKTFTVKSRTAAVAKAVRAFTSGKNILCRGFARNGRGRVSWRCAPGAPAPPRPHPRPEPRPVRSIAGSDQARIASISASEQRASRKISRLCSPRVGHNRVVFGGDLENRAGTAVITALPSTG